MRKVFAVASVLSVVATLCAVGACDQGMITMGQCIVRSMLFLALSVVCGKLGGLSDYPTF